MSLEKLIDRKFYQLNTNVSESVNASRGSIPPSNSNQLASSSSAKQSDRINSNLIPNASKDPNPALQNNQLIFVLPQSQQQTETTDSSSVINLVMATAGTATKKTANHALYVNRRCAWPDCTSTKTFDTYEKFLKLHLNAVHQLDGTAQKDLFGQINIVTNLETELSEKRQILTEMLAHLNKKLEQQEPALASLLLASSGKNAPIVPASHSAYSSLYENRESPTSNRNNAASESDAGSENGFKKDEPVNRNSSFLGAGLHFEVNREYYKNEDVRPPYTYVSMIRQAIIESPAQQLPTTDILDWFEINFSYFRNNTLSLAWESAVRNTLSGQKCFTRVKTGSVGMWKVVDEEYFKNRTFKQQITTKKALIKSEISQPHVSSTSQMAAAAAAASIEKPATKRINNWTSSFTIVSSTSTNVNAQTSSGSPKAVGNPSTSLGSRVPTSNMNAKRKMLFKEKDINEKRSRSDSSSSNPK